MWNQKKKKRNRNPVQSIKFKFMNMWLCTCDVISILTDKLYSKRIEKARTVTLLLSG